jgi:predicted RNase H-like nuclease (RuvC/YqgF family)
MLCPKDPIESPEIPIYKARIDALEMVLEEKDKSIERLENDLKKKVFQASRLHGSRQGPF